jgi:hypothetical protein
VPKPKKPPPAPPAAAVIAICIFWLVVFCAIGSCIGRSKPTTTEAEPTPPAVDTAPSPVYDEASYQAPAEPDQQPAAASGSYRGGSGHASGAPVHVSGYTRKDGTHVESHTRAAPGHGHSHRRK